jgi:hypothetical protein
MLGCSRNSKQQEENYDAPGYASILVGICGGFVVCFVRKRKYLKALGITLIVFSIATMLLHIAEYIFEATDGCPDVYQGISYTSYLTYALSVRWYIIGWLLAFLCGVVCIAIEKLRSPRRMR